MNGPPIREPRWSSPLLLSAYSLVTLLLSYFVLVNNQVYNGLQEEGNPTAWLFQIGGTVLISFLCLAVATMGLVNEGRMRVPYLISWAMFVPSLLWLSHIDWLEALGTGYGLACVESALPDWAIFANGAMIMAGEMLLRCYRHWSALGNRIVKEGADPDPTGTVLDQALRHDAAMIGMATTATVVLFAAMPYLSHSFEVLGYNIGQGYNFLALPIVAFLVLLLIHLTIGLRGRRGRTGRPL